MGSSNRATAPQNPRRAFALLLSAVFASGLPKVAISQTPGADPSARLQALLPADVAARVLERIAAARAQGLPARAVEHRALELTAKGVPPARVELGVNTFANALAQGHTALAQGGVTQPSDAETEAAATALGEGIDGAAVSALARSAPSGRSLAVPLYVLAGLVDRGLPADQALARVQAELAARASDAQLAAATQPAGKPATPGASPPVTGAGFGTPGSPGRPSGVPSGPPSWVPANGGHGGRPTDTPAPSHP